MLAVSAQALSDLLAALGVRVATLGQDGKLTPSQIPALSINDVFSVPNTTAMLALTAHRGDCALIVASDGTVSDSYLLAVDDPTKIANWKKAWRVLCCKFRPCGNGRHCDRQRNDKWKANCRHDCCTICLRGN
ncbi:MAG TPA: hypothetical protein DG942_01895 [Ruminococcaceae bacterium]|nr:hypothetical protein [Oscillospiraceae bacterium]